MNSFLKMSFVVVFLVAAFQIKDNSASSCQYGALACVTSCQYKNCATGHCEKNICKCSRCSNGPSIGKRSLEELKMLENRGNSCAYGGSVGCVTSCAAQGKLCGGSCQEPSNTCICNKC